MIGIPFTVHRESPQGSVDEVLYLRSRRSGIPGQRMREALREYHRAQFEQQRLAAKAAVLLGKALARDSLTADINLEELAAEQESSMAGAQDQACKALNAAVLVAQLAIDDNYGAEECDRIVDVLTDRELHAIVSTVELGEMPKDFFTSRAIPPKPSAIGQSGRSPEERSSPPDLAGTTSSGAS